MMSDQKQQYSYSVRPAEEPTQPKQERIPDPMDNLPDVSSKTGGIPIVLFIIVCITAFGVMALKKAFGSSSLAVSLACMFFAVIMVFGDGALVVGIRRKLRQDGSKPFWQPLSLVLSVLAAVLGAMIGAGLSF